MKFTISQESESGYENEYEGMTLGDIAKFLDYAKSVGIFTAAMPTVILDRDNHILKIEAVR